MWRSNWSRYHIVGVLLFLLIVGGWLFVGRLSLFHTSSYISLFGLDWPKRLYQGRIFWLSKGTEVRQDFVSKYPGLNKINIFLTDRGESNDNVTLAFHLRETCDSQSDLRQIVTTISTADVAGDVFYPFTFAPLDESANRRFCYVIDSVSTHEEENPIGVWVSRVDVYSEGKAFFQVPPKEIPSLAIETTLPGLSQKVFLPIIQKDPLLGEGVDVGFQLHYSGRPLGTLQAFLIHLTEYKPYFFGSSGFYIVLLIVYVSGLFLLLRIGE